MESQNRSQNRFVHVLCGNFVGVEKCDVLTVVVDLNKKIKQQGSEI